MKLNTDRFYIVSAIFGVLPLLMLMALLLLGLFQESLFRWADSDEIEKASKVRLIPAVTWVKSFVEREERLPSEHEFHLFCQQYFGDNDVCFNPEGSVQGHFQLSYWFPDWNLVYNSQSDTITEYWTD